jgi:hypothetical protein
MKSIKSIRDREMFTHNGYLYDIFLIIKYEQRNIYAIKNTNIFGG